ncbi:hypothetical protein M413DRAFT_199970 [Hebeloma cylindrosporum]|uniref:Uncharacterized protein n=1 Tax=Hebeloma cylindrosporum TaxID=76867 RepID=A0A0C2YC33_HEBCY|nr:hypothetical protein M413DRAFT_199970 [Hebeloma cylindrosporum h7]
MFQSAKSTSSTFGLPFTCSILFIPSHQFVLYLVASCLDILILCTYFQACILPPRFSRAPSPFSGYPLSLLLCPFFDTFFIYDSHPTLTGEIPKM